MPFCAVKWCGKCSKNSNISKDGITFHRLPRCPKIKEKWMEATKREDNWFRGKDKYICSQHFTADSFRPGNRRILFPSAVPTQMLPTLRSQNPEATNASISKTMDDSLPQITQQSAVIHMTNMQSNETDRNILPVPSTSVESVNRDIVTQQDANIESALNIPSIYMKTAKTEWKKLRDNHREALKRAKLGQNKLLPAQITTWKFAKAMQFLEPHMKYRITENIDMDPYQSQEGNNPKAEDVSTTEVAIQSDNRKRRYVDCDCPKRSPSPRPKADDALEAFFNSILRSTRDMPPWMQTRVKKKIFAVIIEEEEYLSAEHRHNLEVSTNNQNVKEHSFSPQIKNIKTEVYSEDSFDA